MKKILLAVSLMMTICLTNAQKWEFSSGIPSEVAINSIFNNNEGLIAFGQKMWREGTNYFSEPKSYISRDNGKTWVEFIKMDSELSTSNSLFAKMVD